MKKTILGITLALVGLTLVIGCKRTPEQRAERIAKMVAAKLDLDDSQKAKLDELKVTALEIHRQMKEKRLAEKDKVIAQVRSNNLDQKEIFDHFVQRNEFLELKAPEVIQKLAELHKSLTAEQKEKIVEFIEKHAEGEFIH